ncbi:hypothetical protein N665_1038s0014 [Sinapis alba]|nr:hypothetical protein N665_1038s0014 [Sinapis alba]
MISFWCQDQTRLWRQKCGCTIGFWIFLISVFCPPSLSVCWSFSVGNDYELRQVH